MLPEKKISNFIRRHEGQHCQYCGHQMITALGRAPTRDHVFPKHRGYRFDHLDGRNRAVVCQSCNAGKKHYDIIEWLHRLRKGNDRRAEHVQRFIGTLGLTIPPVDPGRPLKDERTKNGAIVEGWYRAMAKLASIDGQKIKAPQLGRNIDGATT